jgi:hypothetical protein
MLVFYLNVSRVPIIHSKIILKIYLKYAINMPLFHNILKKYPFTLVAS